MEQRTLLSLQEGRALQIEHEFCKVGQLQLITGGQFGQPAWGVLDEKGFR